MIFRRLLLIPALCLGFAMVAEAKDKRPPRPVHSSKCGRLFLEYNLKEKKWKCIFEKKAGKNYKKGSNESDDAAAPNDPAKTRNKELGRKQLQLFNRARAEQLRRQVEQRRYTRELIRESQRRSRGR